MIRDFHLDPMRVAILHDYREQRQMSMKLYAEQLERYLGELGVEVDPVIPPTVLPDRMLGQWFLDKADSYLGRFVRYPRLARKLEADVYHVIDHGQGYLVSSLDAARTVVTCHDIILLVQASGRLRAEVGAVLAPSILRRSLEITKRARRIISDSEQTRRDLHRLLDIDPARVDVIYPGLNYPFCPDDTRRAPFRRRFGLPEGPVVLHVGHTGFYKNIEGCLRVIAMLRKGGLDVTFVRVGRRLSPAQLALAERLGVREAIRELGLVSADDLADAYRASDVLLFPSLYEGFGWPPLEAMASGLPVVTSRSGSLAEVSANAALTAEPEDVERLTDHVAAVVTEPRLAANLRQLGLERARAFDWRRTAERVARIYREVAGA